jgi:uncharacterized membrane-anchored protein
MQQYHVPLLGLRYWIALCLASVFGANMGDFFAHNMGLGHVAGLPFLAITLALVFVLERFERTAHEAFYWLAIVVVRTAATNLADFFSVDLRLAKPWVMTGLAVLLALSVAAAWQLSWHKLSWRKLSWRKLSWRKLSWRNAVDKTDAQSNLLRADFGYWLAMLIAGTLGTVMGDFFSHDLHLGNAVASIVLSALLAPFLVLGVRRQFWSLPFYWTTIVMVRAAGTTVGDLLAARNALGLALSTAATGLLFIGFLILWRTSKGNKISVPTN